ncbi:MAG: hypothetical protein M1484_05065 [Patescibacteria group bacterium]|nr:hypothetical protein [Patescibacteria group bacterium]
MDKGIGEHIGLHRVAIEEVKTVINSDALILEGHSRRKILVGRVGRRILSVIVEMTGNKLKLKTARDADEKERKTFYEYEQSKKEKENA